MVRKLLCVFSIFVLCSTGCSSCDDDAAGDNSATNAATGPNSGTNAANTDGGLACGDGGPIDCVGEGVTVTNPDGSQWTCVQTTCAGKLLECGNCTDDDGDGFIDSRDKECLGPCDNTEGPALTAGVGGETGGPCKADCYFDFGNGAGNDDCRHDSRCDPLAVAPNFYPEGEVCPYEENRVGSRDCPDTQSELCLDFCRPLTPNGCDCFGCCTFPELNGEYVWIGSTDGETNDGTCTFDDIEDPDKCKPCTPVANCNNECGRCELCIGKDTVPEDCFVTPMPGDDMGTPGDMDGGGGTPTNPGQCEEGVQACGLEGQPDCAFGYYCISGCCREVIN